MPIGTITTFSAYPPAGISEQEYWQSGVTQVNTFEPEGLRRILNQTMLLHPQTMADLVLLTVPQDQSIYSYLSGEINPTYLNRMHLGPVLLSAVPDLSNRIAMLTEDGVVSGRVNNEQTVAHVRLMGPEENGARNRNGINPVAMIRSARRADVLKLQDTPWLRNIVTEAKLPPEKFIDYARLESVWLGFVVRALKSTTRHPWFQ